MSAPLRTISVMDDGSLLDAIGRQVEVMPGDPVLRERMRCLITRDCARRLLLWDLLPLVGAQGRQVIRERIATWEDKMAAQAAREMLELAGWPAYDVQRCVSCGQPVGHDVDRGLELCRECTISMHEAADVAGLEAP